ncbi:unnamed protein product [Coregonus sp. 'balchen']|nr:unnamed protein product [Coregonus sp. 'balchen']
MLRLTLTEFPFSGMAIPIWWSFKTGIYPSILDSESLCYVHPSSPSPYWIHSTATCSSSYPLKSLRADAVAGVRKQGSKALMKAHCRVASSALISLHHFKVSSKTDPEAIRKRWLDALEEHVAYSSRHSTQEQTDEEGDEDGSWRPQTPSRPLKPASRNWRLKCLFFYPWGDGDLSPGLLPALRADLSQWASSLHRA